MTVRELRVLVCKIPFELDDASVVLSEDLGLFGARPLNHIEVNAYWNELYVVTMDEVEEERGINLDSFERCVVFS